LIRGKFLHICGGKPITHRRRQAPPIHSIYFFCPLITQKQEGEHADHDDEHYSIECKQHGYIDRNGKVIRMGKYTYQEIEDEITLRTKGED